MFRKKEYRITARYLAGQCSQKEREEIEGRMAEDENFNSFVIKLKNIYSHNPNVPEFTSKEQSFQKLQTRIYYSDRRRECQSTGRNILEGITQFVFRKQALAFTMMILILVSGVYITYKNLQTVDTTEQMAYKTISVDKGKKSRVVLNDGTIINLDAGSNIRYSANFKEDRQIWLTGEAYFQVAHDTSHPFIVHANKAVVQVLGTKFNVRSWKESKSVSVAVTEGKVKLSRDGNSNSKAVFIPKGMVSFLPKEGNPSNPKADDVENYISWLKNEIVLEDVALSEVLSQLNRWYNFEFKVQDPELYKLRLSVHIKKTNVNDILNLISLVTNTTIRKDDLSIHLLQNKK